MFGIHNNPHRLNSVSHLLTVTLSHPEADREVARSITQAIRVALSPQLALSRLANCWVFFLSFFNKVFHRIHLLAGIFSPNWKNSVHN